MFSKVTKYFFLRNNKKIISSNLNFNTKSAHITDESQENTKTHEHNQSESKSDNSYSQWSTKRIGYCLLGGSGVILFGSLLYNYGPPAVDENGKIIEDRYMEMNPIIGYPLRTIRALRDFNQSIIDPISEKLLPDPHPLYQPMTLVIESNHILLHPEWDYKVGWKFKKRPGLDLFLDAVSPFFEVVIFTSDSALNVHPILHQLDPQFQRLHYRLYREATRYKAGTHIKDLSNLNRDLAKVVRIDWDRSACQLQPRNSLLLRRWTGDENDRDLVDLAAFLRMIVSNNLPDVRDGLDHYATFDDPLLEFRQRCEHLKDHMKKVQDDTISKKKKSNAFSNVLTNLKRV